MSDFIKFAAHYADEALAIAEALNQVLGGIALPAAGQKVVQEAIDKLQEASANIQASKPTVVKIAKADIEEAVTKYLDSKAKADAKK